MNHGSNCQFQIQDVNQSQQLKYGCNLEFILGDGLDKVATRKGFKTFKFRGGEFNNSTEAVIFHAQLQANVFR